MSHVKGYSATQITLHWLVAGLILFQLIFGEDMGAAWRAVRQGAAPEMDFGVWAHIVVGIAVLLFVLWRLVLRLTRGSRPGRICADDAGGDMGAASAAVCGDAAGAVSGLAAWFGGVATAAEVHELFKPVLILLVLGHVLAALYHQFIRKDGLLLRMRRPLD